MNIFTAWTFRRLSEEQGPSRLSRVSKMIDWFPIRQIFDTNGKLSMAKPAGSHASMPALLLRNTDIFR